MTADRFLCIPGVDIKDGRCVRLVQGDYARETVFYDNPIEAVQRWVDEGAEVLHVVDLNGARGEFDTNRAVLWQILASFPGRIEIGGGIRTLDRAGEFIDRGALRVIFGSAAVRDPAMCIEACHAWPEQTVIGLDARRGAVAVEGWTEQTALSAIALARRFVDEGLRWIVYTDIERDGMLTGPNYLALEEMVNASGARVIASGGVSSVEQLVACFHVGAAGAIVGRALYDGRLVFEDARHAIHALDIPGRTGGPTTRTC